MIPGEGSRPAIQVAGEEAVIREFVEWMKAALEGFLNRGEAETSYINVFMGMVNFCRLVLEDLESRAIPESVQVRLTYRLIFLDTLRQSLIERHPPQSPTGSGRPV